MNEEILKAQIKKKEFQRFYLIYGEENYRKERYCRELIRAAVPKETESFNYHRFDSENFDLAHFISVVENLPLMSDYKCVLLRDIDAESVKAAEWKEFSAALKDIPERTIIILYYDTVKADKKGSHFKALQEIAKKCGLEAEIGKPTRRVLEKWLLKLIAAGGCTIQDETLNYLIETCGDDMNRLETEAEKLCSYARGGEIEKSSIDLLTARPLNASVYDLAKAIASKNKTEGLRLIDEYFYQREDPILILAALSGAFCDLYRAKAAAESGVDRQDVVNDFSYGRLEFRVRNAFRDCRRMSGPFLSNSLNLLIRADKKLKGNRTDKRLVLEQPVVEMFAYSE